MRRWNGQRRSLQLSSAWGEATNVCSWPLDEEGDAVSPKRKEGCQAEQRDHRLRSSRPIPVAQPLINTSKKGNRVGSRTPQRRHPAARIARGSQRNRRPGGLDASASEISGRHEQDLTSRPSRSRWQICRHRLTRGTLGRLAGFGRVQTRHTTTLLQTGGPRSLVAGSRAREVAAAYRCTVAVSRVLERGTLSPCVRSSNLATVHS